MRTPPGPGTMSSRRRRALTVLVVVLLILLPLYLWPLRGGLGSLPGASALSGPPHDPRDPAALAAIPGEVWDGLMGRTTPTGPGQPANLTMIPALEEARGLGSPDLGDLAYPQPGLVGPPSLGPLASALLDAGSDPPGVESGAESPSTGSTPHAGGFVPASLPGGGNGWGGYAAPPDLGPWPGGGSGPGGPSGGGAPPIWSQPDPPTPTPEPATIVLIGTNAMLFGAVAWKRRWRPKEKRA